MTRHSKNSTDGAVFTYHEKKEAGFGSKSQRVGADSVREFDCCCLSLQPCRDPMVSPDGYLFDKEYIYENLLKQKKKIKALTKEWEEQEARVVADNEDEREKQRERDVEEFSRLETGPSRSSVRQGEDGPRTTGVTSHGVDVTNKLQFNFWLPTNTPDAGSQKIRKPDTKTKNPISKKPLRVKELVAVKFTSVSNKANRTTEEEKKFGRYMCPVCSRTLTNSVKSGVIRTSGSVICSECIARFVEKEKIDPISGKPLDFKKDIIFLKSGGTAFAASKGDEKKVAEKYMPAMRV
ncbi:hypothetical protein NDN08_001979 [Rhodosorus marinus]|uniref:Nitric oxide synthase-interacting protein zinc-finger domain-containing protein n=1 Tax=Rhodosorus marinus TaxID=101924 RepID=A0AAV8UWS4_9RHOD|nr:hypothetical protein NDN08_001979 [Rhodosorus marinus]